MRYAYAGKATVPLVIRTPYGCATGTDMYHSQSPEAWFTHVPGLKVVCPSTPYDAKGLMKSAIRDDNPVIFFEHKLLYSISGVVPEEEYTIPLGLASVKRSGRDITIIATSLTVHRASAAAERLDKDGISAEVIDPRTLLPLDKGTIIKSVKKTGRVLIVHEACKTGGAGGEIAAIIAEEAMDYLEAPIIRLGALFTPPPFSPPLKESWLSPTNEEAIVNAAKEMF
jgi:pyruvate dehydrogenase E1 component beta subunit